MIWIGRHAKEVEMDLHIVTWPHARLSLWTSLPTRFEPLKLQARGHASACPRAVLQRSRGGSFLYGRSIA